LCGFFFEAGPTFVSIPDWFLLVLENRDFNDQEKTENIKIGNTSERLRERSEKTERWLFTDLSFEAPPRHL
jgi:hypothetical protein